MTAEEAVALLVDSFPVLSRYDLTVAAPWLAYERLAVEMIDRRSDDTFWRSACAFIDQVAASDDPVLMNVLVVSVLERLAVDPKHRRDRSWASRSESERTSVNR